MNEDGVAGVPVPPAMVVPDVTVEEVKVAEIANVAEKVENMEELPAPVVAEEVKEIEEKEDVKMDLLGSVEAAVEGMEKEE